MSGFGCISCKYRRRSLSDRPCSSCICGNDHGSKWEPIEEQIATSGRFAFRPPRNDMRGVDHPGHYNQGKIECIDAMVEAFGKEAVKHFCLLNAFKYVWRSDYKNGTQDIKKAMWYLDKYLELEEQANE